MPAYVHSYRQLITFAKGSEKNDQTNANYFGGNVVKAMQKNIAEKKQKIGHLITGDEQSNGKKTAKDF